MSLEPLLLQVGRWQGRSTLQDPMQGVADESASNLTISELLGGKFVRLEYDWGYHGEPQEGSLLIGFEPNSREATAHWIDSWHMGRAVMTLKGSAGSKGNYSVTGSYAIPGGEPWGWRIDIETRPEIRIVMYNITPQGAERPAVEASYSRA